MLQTHLHRFDRRIGVRIGMVVIGAICAVAILAAQASAATTLHFYDQQLSRDVHRPIRHPIGNSNTPPPTGSAISITAIGYAGNSKHHATTQRLHPRRLRRHHRSQGGLSAKSLSAARCCWRTGSPSALPAPAARSPLSSSTAASGSSPMHAAPSTPPPPVRATRTSPSPTPPDPLKRGARHEPLPAARSQTVCGTPSRVWNR